MTAIPTHRPTNAAAALFRRSVGEVYRTDSGRLRRLATSVMGSSTDAEDVVNDAFAALLARETPPSGDLASYLTALVRRFAQDRRSLQASERPLEEADPKPRRVAVRDRKHDEANH